MGGVVRNALRAAIARIGTNELAWKLVFTPLGTLVDVAGRKRRQNEFLAALRQVNEEMAALVPDLRVVAGPFRGLKYPELAAAGSPLAPKLLGTYEKELQLWFEQVIATPYDAIVDVGSAEGYYAVGLARAMPTARVYAFDIESFAREATARMAKANGVEERVDIRDACESGAFATLDLGRRALVISDCEGYEKILFGPQNAADLAGHDMLIEVHDHVDPGITAHLTATFADTHAIEEALSVSDMHKAQGYEVPLLADASFDRRLTLLAEGRPGTMRWLFFQSRRHDNHS